MTMSITKRIAARTETLKAIWCKKDFMAMSGEYRRIRTNMKPMDTCHLCRHKFIDGEMMGLACFEGKGNKMLCGDCADALMASERVGV